MPAHELLPYQGSYLTPEFEHATVSDAMHPGVLDCPADATLTQVARLLALHHVHAAVVQTQDGEAHAWGLVTDADLLRAADWQHEEPLAAEIAGAPAVTVRPGDSLRETVKTMIMRDVTHVVVTGPDGARPIGVLSALDVAGILAWGRG